jgi:tetratricopeptide (TPR) repeat protein
MQKKRNGIILSVGIILLVLLYLFGCAREETTPQNKPQAEQHLSERNETKKGSASISGSIKKARNMVEEARNLGRRKDYVAALEIAKQAISILMREAPFTKETADALALAGFACQKMELWDDAMLYYAKAFNVARTIGYREIIPKLNANMSYVSKMRNR